MQTGKISLICFILVVLFLLLYLFKGSSLIIIIASLMAVATLNADTKFLSLTNGCKFLASTLTTARMVLLFFAPSVYAMIELAKALKNFDINLVTQTLNYVKNHQFTLPESLSFLEPKIKRLLASIDLNSISKQISNYASSFIKSGAKFPTDMVLICIFHFFTNLYGTELIVYIKSVIPIDKQELDDILSEVGNVMAAVLYSMIIIAILQGAFFNITAMFYGYDATLMGVIFAINSLIPALGGALVYIPTSLYEFASSSLGSASVIFIYSVVAISLIADTLVRPLVIKWTNEKLVKTPAKINELLIFLAMIVGISTLGSWGIILGSIILTLFTSTTRPYMILKGKNLI